MGSRWQTVTAGQLAGSATLVFSADAGAVSQMGAVNRASTGSMSVSLHGAGVGLSSNTGAMRVGKTGCEGTVWDSDSSVRCQVGHVVSGSRTAVFTVGSRAGSVSTLFSADMGSGSILGRSNRGGSGSASVTLYGASIGAIGSSGAVRVGRTACERTAWGSDTSVMCQVGHGISSSRLVSVSVGQPAGSTSSLHSSDFASLSVT